MAPPRDLAAVLRIKHMAERAAADVSGDTPMYSAGYEGARAYGRLRAEARALVERAEWPLDEFDNEIPEETFGNPGEPSRNLSMHMQVQMGASLCPRARVLLGQLAGWAAGYAETFEIESRIKAEADARIKAEQERRGQPGFR